jgi:hypothetical protein
VGGGQVLMEMGRDGGGGDSEPERKQQVAAQGQGRGFSSRKRARVTAASDSAVESGMAASALGRVGEKKRLAASVFRADREGARPRKKLKPAAAPAGPEAREEGGTADLDYRWENDGDGVRRSTGRGSQSIIITGHSTIPRHLLGWK